MNVLIVAVFVSIGVGVCAAGALTPNYLPPNYGGAASQPSNQYLAPHAAAASSAHTHYHGVTGGAHRATSSGAHFGSAHHGGAQIPIVRSDYTQDVNSGSYNFGFETGNGIRRDEAGSFVGGWPHGSQSVKGSYSYTGDDGHVYTVNYTADENGFHAEGDHLPTNSPAHAHVNVHAGSHGGHGHGHSAVGGGHHHQYGSYSAASSHAPSAQYIPPPQPHRQQQQQNSGYNYGPHH